MMAAPGSLRLRVHPRRILVAPRVTRVTPLEAPGADTTAEVAIAGMVCGACAARSQAAMLAAPGVRAARVDLDAGTATLRLASGAALDVAGLQSSLQRVVVGMAARRAIERAAAALRRARARTREGRSS